MHRIRLAVLLIAAVGCGYDDGYMAPGSTGTGDVTVGAASFTPTTVYPDNAGLVTWTWNPGGVTHNIIFETDTIPGAADQSAGTFSHTFLTPGTYRFRCTIHSTAFGSGMSGQVVVLAPGDPGYEP